ncbi:MAG TPA: C40 family peptidase [Syntrophorhabdales bacterium]|nr:C40 family peptidase [Syntrophorhabdales bacterium]
MRSQRLTLLTLLGMLGAMTLLAGCAPKKVRIYEGPVEPSQKGEAIVQYASGLIGKPYRIGAKGPEAFDCSGFVYYVYKRYNITIPYTTDELVRTGYEVSRENVLTGDLVVFTIKKNYHIGIMMNHREFIHASTSRGVTVGSLDLPYWRKGLSHFRRVM